MDWKSAYEELATVVTDVSIDDSSFKAIVEELKRHSVKRTSWVSIAHRLKKEYYKVKHRLEILEGKLYSEAKSNGLCKNVSELKLYVKYKIPMNKEIIKLKKELYRLDADYKFAESMEKVLQQRGEILKRLLELDKDFVIGSQGLKIKNKESIEDSFYRLKKFLSKK